MQILRTLRHLFTPGWVSYRHFPRACMARIETAILRAEARHHGEIRVAVETALDLLPLLTGQTARERALEVFAWQRVWDTMANNGVLIYLLLADRDVEIVADRGVAAQVDPRIWQDLSRELTAHFRNGAWEKGMLHAIASVSRQLEIFYPRWREDVNELTDRPIRL
ncbi:MAG TPA: TPM domain-containing protein [Thiobacillaceae bacterium]|nr:TPM domain-containing protein [Thiobacillaceae bacterium]HNU63394.1 TPM domain-containing protein [Thiobacillaceae bacterium]